MLNQANLLVTFWGQAVLYLTHILNATLSSFLSETTSYEIWKKQKPNLTMYCVFVCRAFVHIQKKDRSPLESHTEKCIFIGFNEGYKGWKVYNLTMHKVLTSQDVIFDETCFPGTKGSVSDKLMPKVMSRDLWQDDESQDIEALSHNNETSPVSASDQGPNPAQDTIQVPPDLTTVQSLPEQDERHIEELPSNHRPGTPHHSDETVPRQTPSISPTIPAQPAPITHRSAPLVAQGSRPIRKNRILDYSELEGRTRCTTQLVARRQEVTGTGGVAVQGTDISGRPEEENSDEDGQHVLRTSPIIDSINYIHNTDREHIPLLEALDIALEMAIERVYGAAVRPADSPSGWKEAMARADRDEWIKAAQNEIDALIENGTWELVELPPGCRAIGSRWVFLVK